MKIILIAITLILLTIPGFAQGGADVSSVDLRAAYCLPIIQAGTDATNSLYKNWGSTPRPPEVEEIYRQQNFTLNKLSNYVRARIASLNTNSLVEVMTARSAGSNAVEISLKIAERCQEKIGSEFGDYSTRKNNLNKCMDEGGVKSLKLSQCHDLSFLPY